MKNDASCKVMKKSHISLITVPEEVKLFESDYEGGELSIYIDHKDQRYFLRFTEYEARIHSIDGFLLIGPDGSNQIRVMIKKFEEFVEESSDEG